MGPLMSEHNTDAKTAVQTPVCGQEVFFWYGVVEKDLSESPPNKVKNIVELFLALLSGALHGGTQRDACLGLLFTGLRRIREEMLQHLEAEQGQGH